MEKEKPGISNKKQKGRRPFKSRHAKEVNLALIKTEFEGGLLTQAQICEKYGMHRATLHRWSVSNGWEYASKRERALVEMQTALVRRLGQRRAEISDQHLLELNDIKSQLFECTNVKEASLLSSKADTLVKLIKAERLALAMPDSYRYIEQKNENVYRVEDALKDIQTIEHNGSDNWDIHLGQNGKVFETERTAKGVYVGHSEEGGRNQHSVMGTD